MVEMRKNKALAKLRAGKTVSCTKFNVLSNIPVEIACLCGFDCVWLDMEHTPSDYRDITVQILAAKAHGVDVIVRTPRGEYSNYIRPLELDASGIMVPHIMGADDARQVARSTKFHPVGLRPVDGGNADGGYCAIDFGDYLRDANDQRMVIVQIEDVEAMEDLDEIASVPGIDMLFFGPGDFSQSIGKPGDFSNPELIAARRKVADAALRHGKFAGTVGGLGNMRELKDLGYSFISIGADVVGLYGYFKEISDEFKKEFGED